jgi:hypothetical protein
MTRIDFLFLRRSPVPSEVFLARRTAFPLSLLLFPIAVVCIGGYVFSVVYSAASREEYQTTEMTIDERIRWSYFHEEVDEASKVQTIDDAFRALMGIRHSVHYLPYKIERHRRHAYYCLDTAENHLTACHVQRRDHPSYWSAELTKALREIPKEAVRQDNTPPPPIIDGERESLLPTI